MNIIFLAISASLIAGAIIAVSTILKNRKHLTEHELKSLPRLRTTDPVYKRIIGHLGVCELCRNRVDEINGGF